MVFLMIKKNNKKYSLSVDIARKDVVSNNIVENSDVDNIFAGQLKTHDINKFSYMNESSNFVDSFSTELFNRLGLVASGNNSKTSTIDIVNIYLKRFPEVDYLIDMISSSVIYTSSSNTKKIQVVLNGEYKTINEQPDDIIDTTTSDTTDTDSTVVDVDISLETIDKVDSQYQDINLEIGNLFKQNNVKLSLYSLMISFLKYGCGLFYVDDAVTQSSITFYGLDEVTFSMGGNNVSAPSVTSTYYNESSQYFIKSDEDLKQLKNTIKIHRIDDGGSLNTKDVYFISEKGLFGKSLVAKVINYLKTIELLELSLLIERLSKAKTTHVQKLDLSKIDEGDIASTMMLYKNLLQNKMATSYNEDTDSINLDIVKNLVDNNIIVPTENDNLKIETLRSDFKPLLDDISYYWDKVYNTLGIPIHYRNGDSKSYLNNNMLSMHDNVYAMKIRHYQLIISNVLTFWVENYLKSQYKNLTIKFLNVNIPEFIPISERQETDLDKATKFVTTFTQLEQMLDIKLKQDFILHKLFPNDIISDIIDTKTEEEVANEVEEVVERDTQEDILSLFESGMDKLTKYNKPRRYQKNTIVNKPCNLKFNVEQ